MLRLTSGAKLRTLHFDIETRRVGFFTAGKFSPDGCEPIAIAAGWADQRPIHVWVLGDTTTEAMLAGFREMYDEADIVSGHYVRRFDLPILNGAMMERGYLPLAAKLVSDTKGDLVARAGLSASQENLAEMLRLAEDKFHMNDTRWRHATRLEPEGLELAKKRVVGDVRQHKQLRAALIDGGWLKPPRRWAP